ncbi:MAG: hypothetical protein FWC82_03400, partial [Firmicutes bacterium]|nr:hypothetical protein [Bacillota bacterium]
MQYPITENLGKAMQYASSLAAKLGHSEIGTEHLLYGLCAIKGSFSSEVLEGVGVDAASMAEKIKEIGEETVLAKGKPDYTDRVKQIFSVAHRISQSMGAYAIGTEHALEALLSDPGSMANQILQVEYKVNVYEILDKLKGDPFGDLLSSALFGYPSKNSSYSKFSQPDFSSQFLQGK